MPTETLDRLEQLDEAADVEAREEVGLPGVPGDSPLPVPGLPAVRKSRAASDEADGEEEPAEVSGSDPCPACEGHGYIRQGTGASPLDNACEDCGGTGYPGISPDDPLPELGGPPRVPYLQVRYHFGRPLWA